MHRSTHHKLQRAITFDPTEGFLGSTSFQNHEAKIFPKVGLLRPAALAAASKFSPGAINSPNHALDRGDHIILDFALWLDAFCTFFLSSKNKKTHNNTHQSFLILLSSPKTQGIVHISNLPFLGSTLWIWVLGVWM